MSGHRFLCLGAGDGWHSNQLLRASRSLGCEMHFATYESLRGRVADGEGCELSCEAGPIREFDAILTRTMPLGSLEQVTFRLAVLHAAADCSVRGRGVSIVNPPRSLEIAIDKFATLVRVAELGYNIPDTIAVQSRAEAMEAFGQLGGDCIVKPVFGGEGRGVMRVRDAELAWYAFSTLEQLDAVCYVQRFVAPGGRDTRLLVLGEEVIGIRRWSSRIDFRTNVSSGGNCAAIELSDQQSELALQICRSLDLRFASVDLIDSDDGPAKVLEVNAIPGWKGAQGVYEINIAERIVRLLMHETSELEAGRS